MSINKCQREREGICNKNLKILHYYWTQYNDMEKPGGGIRVYLENIIGIQKQNDTVYMLNSGVDYDLKHECYIKEIADKNDVKQYSIINSPILAPSKCSFNNQKIYLEDKILADVLDDFLSKNGPFDVIHFHSLEGLSINVLHLKNKFPQTKFILSLHNYYIFCPQVNLWKNDMESCENYHCGKDCVSCVPNLPNSRLVKFSYMLSTCLRCINLEKYSEIITRNLKLLYTKHKSRSIVSEKQFDNINNTEFERFRTRNIEIINKYIDTVICVSKRVMQIAVNMGISKDKCQVAYIGTQFAENQITTIKYPIINGILRLLYMGYMRKDKGFYFFVEALENIPPKLAKKIEVVIAARFDDLVLVDRLKLLKKKFKNIILYNGYTHTDIPLITKGVNLGVVPVMWEDNLPQVAMEMKAMGIPILASDRGGASELTDSVLFKFKAGNTDDFINKIAQIIYKPQLLNLYYDKHFILQNNLEHCLILRKIYGE